MLTQAVVKGKAITTDELSASTSAISVPNDMDAVTVTLLGTASLAGYLQPGAKVQSTPTSPRCLRGARRRPVSRCRAPNWRCPTSRSSMSRAPFPRSSATSPRPGEPCPRPRRFCWPSRRHRLAPSSFSPRTSPCRSFNHSRTPSSTAAAVHRHRSDDGSPVIARRILVISRSPALSRAIQASLGPGYQVIISSNVADVVEAGARAGSIRRAGRRASVRQPCRHGAACLAAARPPRFRHWFSRWGPSRRPTWPTSCARARWSWSSTRRASVG